MGAYRKYVHWLDDQEFAQAQERLAKAKIRARPARKAVCLPLAADVDAEYVEADAWLRYSLCRRQMSWHAGSQWAGKTLLVTSAPIEGLEAHSVISQVKFKPPSLPNAEELKQLAGQESYLAAAPSAWQNPGPEDREQTERWQKVMGLGHVPFEELFVSHCANHANFIEPRFFVDNGEGPVPYSIARTPKACSACLELYGIIGDQHHRKLVTPCPGAVVFARMAANRYYEVVKL